MKNDSTKGKYFYLMLKENFYDSDDMVLLESMENGYLYSNILLKLYLKSLKDKGKLMYKDRIPYNIDMLAKLTRHNVDVIRVAIQIFEEMGIIEILDNGAIYMLDIENYIGKSSTEADRRRKYDRRIAQEKQKILQNEKSCEKSHEHIDIDLDIDINTNINTKKEKIKKEKKYYDDEALNNLFLEFLQLRKKIKAVNSERAINMLIKKLSNYDDETKVKMIEQSILNSWKDVYEIKKQEVKKYSNEWWDKL